MNCICMPARVIAAGQATMGSNKWHRRIVWSRSRLIQRYYMYSDFKLPVRLPSSTLKELPSTSHTTFGREGCQKVLVSSWMVPSTLELLKKVPWLSRRPSATNQTCCRLRAQFGGGPPLGCSRSRGAWRGCVALGHHRG